MAQETQVWEKETSTQGVRTDERKPMESATGTDKPSGDGGVGAGQVERASGEVPDGPTGQDHSTDITPDREPDSGVGAIQDRNLIRNDVADLPPDNG